MRTLPLAVVVALVGCGADSADSCDPTIRDDPSPHTAVTINEVLAKSADGTPDWIELHNASDAPADIGCWSVVDKSSKHTPYRLPPGVVLDAGGFLVLRRDKTGVNGFPWGFGQNGDTALLRDEAGRIADETSWDAGQAPAGRTWGRYPDGTGPFATLSEPTPDAPNAPPVAAP